MTKRCLLTLSCLATMVGCSFDSVSPDGQTQSFSLESRTDDGRLTYCPDGGDCLVVSNPGDCDTLQIDIDTTTGATCERCLDASGGVLYERCEGTSVACTVVTAPDPDCVVCAHIDGPVIFSSCQPQEPGYCEYFPLAGTTDSSAPSSDGPVPRSCERCYTADGDLLSDTCAPVCTNIACPEVACADGYFADIPPGECCPVCLPYPNCEDTVCPAVALPICGDGSVPVRDPNDCCGYTCEPIDCRGIACPQVDIDCPEGTRYDNSFPNCCGTCVPDKPRLCMSSDDCNPDEYCSDECFSGCEAGIDCPSVCYGACRPTACPPVARPIPFERCEGQWIESDAVVGCPAPPICVCPDGSQSFDGECRDACENIGCTAPSTGACPPGQTWTNDFPYCCGGCIEDDFALCAQTGGSWGLECAHTNCSVMPGCITPVLACNCEPFSSWADGIGCVEDPSCRGNSCVVDGVPMKDGERSYSDGCSYCDCIDGQLICTDGECDPCWGSFRDGSGICTAPFGGDAPAYCCDDQGVCEASGGTWDPIACGDYTCGAPQNCDAVIPGCDCGAGANFEPGLGCVPDPSCATNSCFYDGAVYGEGASWPADDGCNHCTCFEGSVYCTEIACAP